MMMTQRIVLLLLLLPLKLMGEEVAAEDYSFASEFLRMMMILGIMVGALLIVAWGLKRVMATRIEQMNASSNIRILEHRSLTPKSHVYLIEVEGRKLVVAESATGVHHLTTLEPTNEAQHEMV